MNFRLVHHFWRSLYWLCGSCPPALIFTKDNAHSGEVSYMIWKILSFNSNLLQFLFVIRTTIFLPSYISFSSFGSDCFDVNTPEQVSVGIFNVAQIFSFIPNMPNNAPSQHLLRRHSFPMTNRHNCTTHCNTVSQGTWKFFVHRQ